jgi:hypothetical protein
MDSMDSIKMGSGPLCKYGQKSASRSQSQPLQFELVSSVDLSWSSEQVQLSWKGHLLAKVRENRENKSKPKTEGGKKKHGSALAYISCIE